MLRLKLRILLCKESIPLVKNCSSLTEAATRGILFKRLHLKFSQYSQEKNWFGVSI